MNRKKMLTIGAVAVVSASILITGTFAWFASQSNTLNKFSSNKSGAGGTSGLDVIENFDKESANDFKPGVQVQKEVKVSHSGSGRFIARVRLEEFLQIYQDNGEGGVAGNALAVIYDADPNRAVTEGAGYYPVLVEKDAHDNALAAGGFTEANVVAGTPEGVTIYKKATATYINGSVSVAYEFTGYKAITEGETTSYQPVQFTPSATATNGAVTQDQLDAITATPGTSEFNDALVNLYETTYGAPTVADITYAYNNRLDSTEVVHTTYTENSDVDSNLTEKIALQIGTVKPLAEWNGPEDAWFYDTDGWCYYGKVFEDGLTSPNLLNSVTMKATVQSEMDGVDYKINVRLQTVQPTAEAILAEWTKEITATNTDSSWEMTGATNISDLAKTMLSRLTQENVAGNTGSNSATTPVEEATTPAAEEVTTPAAEEVTTPAAEEVTTPAAEEVTTPAAEEVTTPAAE